jgi:SH3 domain protein
MNRAACFVLLAWLGTGQVFGADTVYVSDHLLLGVHEAKTASSAILKLVPTGTALEVLARENSLLHVKTPDGTRGWVDARYVVADKPARLQLAELEAEHRKTLEEVEALKTKVEELREATASAEREPAPEADAAPTTELERLRRENRELKETIDSAEAQIAHLAELQASSSESETSGLLPAELDPATWGLKPWMGWPAGALFIAGLALGLYLMDRTQRRRHGGFRV